MSHSIHFNLHKTFRLSARSRLIGLILVPLLVASADLGWHFHYWMAVGQVSASWNPNGYWQRVGSNGGTHNYDSDGGRNVVGRPSAYSATVWIFGNSGLDDPYNPDALTAASQLQKLLNDTRYSWRVMNYSTGGQIAEGELAWLHDTPIHPGDLVVFVDGAMDIVNLIPLQRYRAAINAARDYAHGKAATFYHFVQPNVNPLLDIAAGAPRIILPPTDFVEGSHTTAKGGYKVARAIFQAITSF